MGVPYAFVKAFRGEKPYLEKEGRLPKEQAAFLLRNGNMKRKHLGACLDSCRWGSQTTIMYEMTTREMISFIQKWMQQNERTFPDLWHERQINEPYTKFELPHIHYETCPRNKKHQRVIKDLGGRLRCAHKEEKRFKPSFVEYWDFFDEVSGMEQRHFHENEPHDPLPDDAWDEKTGELLPEYKTEFENYQKQLEEFEQEEPIFEVTDACYAVLSDKGRVLSLETILKRLNLRPEFETIYCGSLGIKPCMRVNELSKEEKETYELSERCPGHIQPHEKSEFPFDGWTLALYVQKWYEQLPEGQALIFEE